MAAAFAYLGMLLLSLVVALLAALQLGDFFATGSELLLVIAAIAVAAMVSIAVLAAVESWTRQPSLLNALALGLAIAAAALALWPGAVERIARLSTHPDAAGTEQLAVTLELLVPALLIVVVQWGLLRRRMLRAAGEDDFSRWPWLTTTLAGLAILNPVGLSFAWSAFQAWPARWPEDWAATVTGSAFFGLVVMAVAECYIRGAILRRRLESSPR